MDKRNISTIVRMGSTYYLKVTEIVPKEWKLVQTKVISSDEETITIQVRKLLGEEDIASNTAANQANKQNTSKSR